VAEALWVAEDPWWSPNPFDVVEAVPWSDADGPARDLYRAKARVVISRLGLEVES
jgi:hypothetical protein